MTKDINTPFAFVGRLTGFAQHADMDGVLFHMFLRRHVLTKIQLVPLGLSVGGQRSINQPTLNLLTYYFTHIFHSASCVINVRVWKRRTRQCPPLHLIFFFLRGTCQDGRLCSTVRWRVSSLQVHGASEKRLDSEIPPDNSC